VVEINGLTEVRGKKVSLNQNFLLLKIKKKGKTIPDILCSVEGIPPEPHFLTGDSFLLCLG